MNERDAIKDDESSDKHTDREVERPPAMPRWVKIFGIIGLVLILIFVILHLTGRGLGGHMH